MTSRVRKSVTTEDSFFAETLGTDRTIRHCLTLRPRREERDGEAAFREVRTIMELGSGLNGHPNICHGGFVATMLDEVLGVLIQLNLEVKARKLKERDSGHPGLSCFTACKLISVLCGRWTTAFGSWAREFLLTKGIRLEYKLQEAGADAEHSIVHCKIRQDREE
jgi:hypothetical protein